MWRTVKLGEIAKASGGFGFAHKFQGKDEGQYPFFKVSDMNTEGNDVYMKKAANYVSEADLKAMKAKTFKAGTIVFPKIGGAISTNKKRILIQDSVVDNNVMGVQPFQDIDTNFLYKIFLNLDLYELSNKAALPSITNGSVENIEFPLPPLAEQQRIVEKLDRAFEEIDRAIEATGLAVEKAKLLIEKSLNELTRASGKEVLLSDVCGIESKLIDPRDDPFKSRLHIGAGNISSMSNDVYDVLTAEEEGLISGKFSFNENTVLYSKIRPYLRKVHMPNFDGICSADIYPLTPDDKVLKREFLFYLLLSEEFTNYAMRGSARAGMPKVNRDHLFNFKFNLPDLNEQVRLSERAYSIMEEVGEIQGAFFRKTSLLEKLKSAILAQELKGPES